MLNIPTSKSSDTRDLQQAESALERANAQSKNKNLSQAERDRAVLIKRDLIKHAASLAPCALIVLTLFTQSAIAAERWQPNPKRGSAQITAVGGRR